jgi:hypothetical protein
VVFGSAAGAFRRLRISRSSEGTFHGCRTHTSITQCKLSPYIYHPIIEETKEALGRLKYLVSSITRKDPRAKIILMGDFIFWLKEVGEFVSKIGMKPIYREGGTLDQVITNLGVMEKSLTEANFTDHKVIKVKLELIVKPGDLDI